MLEYKVSSRQTLPPQEPGELFCSPVLPHVVLDKFLKLILEAELQVCLFIALFQVVRADRLSSQSGKERGLSNPPN